MAVISVRTDDDTVDLVDKAARATGQPRSHWAAHVIDRGLAGAGLLTSEQVAQRREAREVARTTRETRARIREGSNGRAHPTDPAIDVTQP